MRDAFQAVGQFELVSVWVQYVIGQSCSRNPNLCKQDSMKETREEYLIEICIYIYSKFVPQKFQSWGHLGLET